jgi:RNA polymerase sigma factor (TIGR02999 family)
VPTAARPASAGADPTGSALFALVYDELRALARHRMRRLPPGHTIQPTALVHEAYLRLCGSRDPGFAGRGPFLRAAARAMRDIIVDRVRRRSSLKRGGGRRRVELDPMTSDTEPAWADILPLNDAVRRLEATDPRPAEVVVLRFFGGLTAEEAAEALGVTTRTIERDWRYARAWLHRALRGPTARGSRA